MFSWRGVLITGAAALMVVGAAGCGSTSSASDGHTEQACTDITNDLMKVSQEAATELKNPTAAAQLYQDAANQVRAHSEGASENVAGPAREAAGIMENAANKFPVDSSAAMQSLDTLAGPVGKLNAAC